MLPLPQAEFQVRLYVEIPSMMADVWIRTFVDLDLMGICFLLWQTLKPNPDLQIQGQ
jgi:hypothetical protein